VPPESVDAEVLQRQEDRHEDDDDLGPPSGQLSTKMIACDKIMN
jgi:hypothetical protein